MNSHTKVKAEVADPILQKADPTISALFVAEVGCIGIRAGTKFGVHSFDTDVEIPFGLGGDPVAGADYIVVCDNGMLSAERLLGAIDDAAAPKVLGGFHFAPGSNAGARKGGNETPAINLYSLWDRNFRPACADPRGMALVEKPGGRFWCDIYLLGVNHLSDGTSKLGVTIADGNDRPLNPDTRKSFKRLDYETAVAVLAHHGKQVPSLEEFFALAIGVTERSSCDDDPVTTKLDAARSSKFGIMQATGNMWVWGHDGDPDEPRASIFGGSWWSVDDAGSRYAYVGVWADSSGGSLGARGRSDHLQLG